MSEPAAKLRVKVTLHRDLPVEPMPQLKRAKTPTSKLKLLLLVSALVAAGVWGWQQLHHSAAITAAAAVEDIEETVAATADSADAEPVTAAAEPAALPQKEGLALAENGRSNDIQADSSDALPQPAVEQNVVAAPTQTAAPDIAPETAQPDTELQSAAPTAAAKSNEPSDSNSSIIKLPEGFSRIVLAADMEQLEPGTPVAQLVAKKDIQRLYLFTELKGYAGQQLKHRWSFNGVVQTEALLTIEDSPWRTYSEKWLLPDQLGAWRVEIIDQQQNVLYSHDFQYQ